MAIQCEFLLNKTDMKINITNDNNKTIKIQVPNKFAIFVLKRFLYSKAHKEGTRLTHKQKKLISKLFRKNRKKLKGWKLVEVLSSDGDKVDIYL